MGDLYRLLSEVWVDAGRYPTRMFQTARMAEPMSEARGLVDISGASLADIDPPLYDIESLWPPWRFPGQEAAEADAEDRLVLEISGS